MSHHAEARSPRSSALPWALALLYYLGAATMVTVSGFQRCDGISSRMRRQHSRASRVRVRQRTVVELAKDIGRDRRTFAGSVRWGGGGARTMVKPSSSLRCAQENGDKGNQDWGGEDYSQYGYEPEYEMQDPESFSDQAKLEKWREDRLLTNDRWQFGIYGKQHAGDWFGSWQEYVANDLSVGEDLEDDEAGAPMVGLFPGSTFVANTRITRRVVDEATGVKVFDHVHEPPDGNAGGAMDDFPHRPSPVVDTLFTDSFRGGNGTQVVGNTYTIAAERESDDKLGDVWVELGLRARDVRVRCMFQYGRDGEGGSATVQRVFLAREGLGRLPLADGKIEAELYGAAGKGLYDPPRLSRSPLYFSIYAQGGLTIRFPLKVAAGEGGVFSVDWTAGDMRYQADRLFDVLDGSCSSLQVTEIGTADSEIYLPEEKF